MSVTISARNQVGPRFTVSPHQHRHTTTQPTQALQPLFAMRFAGILVSQHRRNGHRSTLGQINAVLGSHWIYKQFDGLFICLYNITMFAWDESKRQTNIREHGMDFIGCDAVFDGPVVAWDDTREAYGELRINLLGFLDGVVVHLTYTERGNDLHIISLRKAEKHEIRKFAQGLSH